MRLAHYSIFKIKVLHKNFLEKHLFLMMATARERMRGSKDRIELEISAT